MANNTAKVQRLFTIFKKLILPADKDICHALLGEIIFQKVSRNIKHCSNEYKILLMDKAICFILNLKKSFSKTVYCTVLFKYHSQKIES